MSEWVSDRADSWDAIASKNSVEYTERCNWKSALPLNPPHRHSGDNTQIVEISKIVLISEIVYISKIVYISEIVYISKIVYISEIGYISKIVYISEIAYISIIVNISEIEDCPN